VVAFNVETRRIRSAAAVRTEFRLKTAVVEATQVDSRGRLLSLVVDGRSVVVEGLTRVESGVAVGRMVEVEGLIIGETHVATKVTLRDPPSDRRENRPQDRQQGRQEDRQQERQQDRNGKGGPGSSNN
jgi:hypothetical protein